MPGNLCEDIGINFKKKIKNLIIKKNNNLSEQFFSNGTKEAPRIILKFDLEKLLICI